MKYILSLLFLFCLRIPSFAQFVYTIKADSVKITNCDSAELIIENHTQGIPGFLYNTGNGRTIFKRALIQLDDTTFLIGGDTLRASLFSFWKRNGNNISNINTGNVGIGRVNPNVLLDLPGPVNIDDTSAYRIHYHPVLRVDSLSGSQYINLFVGDSTGANNSGSYSTFLGNRSGFNNSGNNGTFVGYRAGHDSQGNNNTLSGYMSGMNNSGLLEFGTYFSSGGNSFYGSMSGENSSGASNTFMGLYTGFNNEGVSNAFIGDLAGYNNAGDANCFFGEATGYNSTGRENSFYGTASGYSNNGYENAFVGIQCGMSSQGNRNVFMGSGSGFQNNGSYNTFLGWQAGDYPNNQVGVGIATNVTLIGNSAVVGTWLATASPASISDATAIGANAQVNASYTMTFGDDSVHTWLFNSKAVASSGAALVVGNNSTNGNGAYLTTGGVWTNASDRNKKEHFQTLNGDDLLQKISALPITRWNYKGLPEQHIGPVAQDFYRIFRVGTDDKTISTIDPSGIALAGVQSLFSKWKETEQRDREHLAKIVSQDKEIHDMREQLQRQQTELTEQQAKVDQLLERFKSLETALNKKERVIKDKEAYTGK